MQEFSLNKISASNYYRSPMVRLCSAAVYGVVFKVQGLGAALETVESN